jgi:hypothetical protein
MAAESRGLHGPYSGRVPAERRGGDFRRRFGPHAGSLAVFLWAAGLNWSAAVSVPAAAGEALKHRVEITGGRDETGQFYRWVVRNLSDSPIVFVEFPHYRADTFFAPEEWRKEFINRVGDPNATGPGGVCRASTDDPRVAITRGRAAEFGMRLARGGANRGRGTVVVRFLDGAEVKLAGVELPGPPSIVDRLAVPGGLAVILLILWAMQRLRSRRGGAAGGGTVQSEGA